uniref:replication initiation protein n=1 Tax=Cupriavidus taiwanensis TaxID=164546 RepID=UPI003F494B9B
MQATSHDGGQEPRKNHLKKHVAAIHTSGELSLLERKLSNVLLLNAYDDLPTARTHKIPVAALCVILGWETSTSQRKLKDALLRLMSTPIEFNLMGDNFKGGEDWSATSIISYGRIHGGVCTYRYDEALAEKLYDPAIYAKVHIGVQTRFNGSYALALYENCLRYLKVGSTGEWDVLTLRKLLGATSDHYSDFGRLRQKVLTPAIKEINRVSDIELTLHLIKVGPKVTAVRFEVDPNRQASLLPPDESDDVSRLRDSPLFARLRKHGIGEKLALSFVAEDPERAARIVELAEEKDGKGEIRSSTGGFIRSLMDSGADVQKSVQQRRKEDAAQKAKTQRELDALADLRAEFERSTKAKSMQALTPAELLDLARVFITTDAGKLYSADFSETKTDHFPAGAARVAFRRWLPSQVGLRLDDAAFAAWLAERAKAIHT